MSQDRFGFNNCYICNRPLEPLVSICWSCGYSQLPNPMAQGAPPPEGLGTANPDASPDAPKAPPARDDLRADLNERLSQAKADFKSRIKGK